MESDAVLAALQELSSAPSGPLPRPLDEYLRSVARTGDPVLPWAAVKPLFQRKLALVIDDFLQSPECRTPDTFDAEAMRTRLVRRLDSFDACPFTVQRLSELLTTPRSEYNQTDKFMRAIEKNVLVVSGRERQPITNGTTSSADEVSVQPSVEVPMITTNGVESPEAPEVKRPRTELEEEEGATSAEEIKAQTEEKTELQETSTPMEEEVPQETLNGSEEPSTEPQSKEITEEPQPENAPQEPAEKPAEKEEVKTSSEEVKEPQLAVETEQNLQVENKTPAPLASPEKDLVEEGKVSAANGAETVVTEAAAEVQAMEESTEQPTQVSSC
ncbi:serine/threonine-protein phosphatase 4 regulatory subunit 2-like [Neocloeon triangulifer]|uniref:serine/threonine-protein phosphatase 4 regulatory subunit 2-like n=1 Tax=Neocloeon triangulifer TaxID=2078957 RepID=UPI00286F80B3|nr:serine/threonine-protein phosphatase 4 regulatory subunit 2-like [Neocloeon triangulifer]